MRRAYVVCLIQILIQLSATTLLLCQSNRVPPLSPIANGVSPISVHEALTRDGSGKFPPSFEAGQWQPDGLVNSLSFAPWPPFGSRLHPGTSSGVFPTQPRNSRNLRIKAPRAAGASIFEMAATYDSGGGAVSVAVGDFKGDGKLDLVVANGSSDTVGILLGNGDGTFQAVVPYGSGGNATSVVVADVNGDGKLDLVVANECGGSGDCYGSMGTVAVLLGNGDGTFQAAVTYSAGGLNATSVAVADVNGDGKPDLVVAICPNNSGFSCGNGASAAVSVLFGNGDGTFQAVVSYATGSQDANSVAVADVNGDGKPDIVVASACVSNPYYCEPGAGVLSVLLGNGDGTFQAARIQDSGGLNPTSVAVADVNGDGKPDLIVANGYSTSGIGVLLGNGDGTFQAAVTYGSGGYEANAVAVADVNGDGKPDLVVANCGGTSDGCNDGNNAAVGVLLGNGDGTFQAAMTYASGGIYGISVAIKDVNGDGKPDLLVVNQDACGYASCLNGSVGVLLGNGDGTFRAAPIYGSGGSPTFSLAVGDVNGDGKPDLVMAVRCSGIGGCADSAVGVLLGNGDGTFKTAIPYGSGGYDARSAVAADVNGDGKLDLVVANECTNDNEPVPNCNSVVGVLLGNGDGTFQPAASYGTGGYYADSVAVEDVNGDGKLDIVVANQCADSSCTNANVGVLLGSGDGTFQTAVTYGSGGYYATSLAVADVNGDGKPDLLVANECAIGSNCGSSGKVGVLLGNGDGTFQAPVTYSSGGQFPYSLAVGDVNGDGKPDLVVTNLYENSGSTNGSLGVLLGNGDGTFRKGSTTMIPAYGLGAIVFSDFNGDGKLDVASGDGYGDGILLLGNGNGTFQSFMTLGAGGFGIAVGDFNLDGKPDLAVGGVAILLNITGEATTTTLFSSHNPSSLNQRTTFTATVSSPVGIPAGKVTFMNGTTALATKTLIGGAASFATSNLPAGMNSITAVYGGGGEANFGASTSAAVNQSVLTPTATTLSSSANPSGYGQKVTFTAVVTSGAGAPADGETVSFVEDLTILASKKLSGGSASFTTSALPVGTHLITAVYGGDSSLARSASAWVKQVVKKAGE